jgi:hypothetical protein
VAGAGAKVQMQILSHERMISEPSNVKSPHTGRVTGKNWTKAFAYATIIARESRSANERTAR